MCKSCANTVAGELLWLVCQCCTNRQKNMEKWNEKRSCPLRRPAGGCNKRVPVPLRIERLRGSPQTPSSSSMLKLCTRLIQEFFYRGVLGNYRHACPSPCATCSSSGPRRCLDSLHFCHFFFCRTKLYVLLGLGSDYYLNNEKKRRQCIAIECSCPCRIGERGVRQFCQSIFLTHYPNIFIFKKESQNL